MAANHEPKFEADGWCYSDPPDDEVKLVTLNYAGARWVGLRTYSKQRGWMKDSEPSQEGICAWRDLPKPAQGFWDRGKLIIPK